MEEMKKIYLDCDLWLNKEDVHTAFRSALSFPEYYGNNLDALYDMLSSVRNVDLTLDHTSVLKERFSLWGQNLYRLVMDASRENPGLRIMLRP